MTNEIEGQEREHTCMQTKGGARITLSSGKMVPPTTYKRDLILRIINRLSDQELVSRAQDLGSAR